jgi:hypothetical protein
VLQDLLKAGGGRDTKDTTPARCLLLSSLSSLSLASLSTSTPIRAKASVKEPEYSARQMNGSECVAFMQGAELFFMPRDDMIRKITLQKSKIAGRETVVTYTYFASHFIVFSADYCISMVTVDGDRTKSAVLAFLCPYCGNIFKDWHKLHRDHIHLHKGPVSCGICGPKIDKYQYLDHKPSCKFTCVDCGKQFDKENRLITHKRIHRS